MKFVLLDPKTAAKYLFLQFERGNRGKTVTIQLRNFISNTQKSLEYAQKCSVKAKINIIASEKVWPRITCQIL